MEALDSTAGYAGHYSSHWVVELGPGLELLVVRFSFPDGAFLVIPELGLAIADSASDGSPVDARSLARDVVRRRARLVQFDQVSRESVLRSGRNELLWSLVARALRDHGRVSGVEIGGYVLSSRRAVAAAFFAQLEPTCAEHATIQAA